MNNEKPFDVMRWDSTEPPTEERLEKILSRECKQHQEHEFSPGKTDEMKTNTATIAILKAGALYFGFPGYGSVDLKPGDILEIKDDITYDITVTSDTNAFIYIGDMA